MKLPTAWLEALTAIQQEYPEAVIAGGALRDLLAERPVKDVDIFIANHGHLEEVGDKLENVLCRTVGILVSAQVADYSEALEDVAGVFQVISEAELPNETPIQIIMLAAAEITMESVVERIDMGICRVATNGREDLIHPDFVHDLTERMFTVRNTGDTTGARLARTKRRHERLQEKYQGWPLILPGTPLYDASHAQYISR